MNVIWIMVDSLRYDHIGTKGNDWIKTPNLDRFASRSLVFGRCTSEKSRPTQRGQDLRQLAGRGRF